MNPIDNITDPVRITWTLSIGRTDLRRGEMTIERDEWDSMTPDEREECLDEMYETETSNFIDGGWDVVNADIDDTQKD